MLHEFTAALAQLRTICLPISYTIPFFIQRFVCLPAKDCAIISCTCNFKDEISVDGVRYANFFSEVLLSKVARWTGKDKD